MLVPKYRIQTCKQCNDIQECYIAGWIGQIARKYLFADSREANLMSMGMKAGGKSTVSGAYQSFADLHY